MRPYILAETNWKTVREIDYELAILPWGATEAHNLHLPYATDVFESEYFAWESAKIAWEKGAKVIVLPAIAYGVNTGQADVKLDMNLNPSTQLAILDDLITVLNRQGIMKLVILNSHGGNDFKMQIRELNLRFPEMLLSQCHWFKMPGIDEFFEDTGEHAGEMETSLMQLFRPDLVRSLEEAGEGKAKVPRIPALREGWAWSERKWTQVTSDTGIGNPKQATKEKGERFFRYVTEKVGLFFYDMAVTPPEDMYIDPELL